MKIYLRTRPIVLTLTFLRYFARLPNTHNCINSYQKQQGYMLPYGHYILFSHFTLTLDLISLTVSLTFLQGHTNFYIWFDTIGVALFHLQIKLQMSIKMETSLSLLTANWNRNTCKIVICKYYFKFRQEWVCRNVVVKHSINPTLWDKDRDSNPSWS